jgi:hypothetical protein
MAGGAGPDQIETPFLQLVLTRIWSEEIRSGSRVLHRSTFDGRGGLGGAQEIVSGYFDDVMAALGPDAQEACARFFDRLVTPSGNKIAYAVEDLARHAGDLGARVPQVLKTLSDARLLYRVPSPPDHPELDCYEIFHDVMAPAVLQWRAAYLERRRRAARARRRRWLLAAIATSLLAVAAARALWDVRDAAKRAEQLGQELMTSGQAELAAIAFARSRRLYRSGLDRLSEARAASLQRVAETVAAPWGFLEDLRTSAVRELHGDVVRIGRDVPEGGLFNDISFPDQRISRRHLEIRRKGLYVEDLRTTNGTTLNAKFLEYGQVAPLRDGDLLVLAGVEAFRFRTDRPDTSPAPPSDSWAILLDGSRSVEYLTSSRESVVVGQARVAAEHGLQPSAVLWVQRTPGAALMYGRAVVLQDFLIPGQLDALFSGIAPQIIPPDRRRKLAELLSRGGYPVPARWVQLNAEPMATRVGKSPTAFRWFQVVPMRESRGF